MKLFVLCILAAFMPTAAELWNDRKGDSNKTADVIVRVIISLGYAWLTNLLIGKPIIDSFILALAIHFAFFDYLINIILVRNDVLEMPRGETWFSYLGKSSRIDRIGIWARMDAWDRLIVRVIVLAAAVIIWIV